MASPAAPGALPGADLRWYFEDVEVGVPFQTPGITITEAHVALFSGLCDARGVTAGAVPDLLPLCLSSGLGWRLPHPPLAVLAFMGFEWRFHLTVRLADTIRSRSRTTAKRAMKDGGVVFEEREILNQHGDRVQSGRLTLLVARRPIP